jgi:hypothetical protein
MTIPKTRAPRRRAARVLDARHRQHGRWNSATGEPGGRPNRASVSTPKTSKGNPRRHRWAKTARGRLRNLLAGDATATAHLSPDSPRRRISVQPLAFLETFSEKD